MVTSPLRFISDLKYYVLFFTRRAEFQAAVAARSVRDATLCFLLTFVVSSSVWLSLQAFFPGIIDLSAHNSRFFEIALPQPGWMNSLETALAELLLTAAITLISVILQILAVFSASEVFSNEVNWSKTAKIVLYANVPVMAFFPLLVQPVEWLTYLYSVLIFVSLVKAAFHLRWKGVAGVSALSLAVYFALWVGVYVAQR